MVLGHTGRPKDRGKGGRQEGHNQNRQQIHVVIVQQRPAADVLHKVRGSGTIIITLLFSSRRILGDSPLQMIIAGVLERGAQQRVEERAEEAGVEAENDEGPLWWVPLVMTLSCLKVWRMWGGGGKALADPGAGANEGATEGGGEQAANGNAAVGAFWNCENKNLSHLEALSKRRERRLLTRPKWRNQHRLGVLRPQHRPQFTAQRVA